MKTALRLFCMMIVALSTCAQAPDDKGPGFPLIGKIKPRSAKEIASSQWSIGGETLDRDFAVFNNYKSYLGPLGAKAIRVQAGWAKCEKEKGVYNWAWLDEIVDGSVAQGVKPWLETSYGNPIYPGGGGTNLGAGFPKSEEALAAWDKWVTAMVRRYKDRVNEWEIWNEPDLTKGNKAEDYTALFIRTATIIRAEQPAARIYALALAGNMKFAEAFLDEVQKAGKTALMDAVTVHGYPRNPDETNSANSMKTLLEKYAPKAHVRQGETGAPSAYQENFALSKIKWTDTTQAKWNMRRMLAHHGKGVPFNLFTISDMHYVRDGKAMMNYKGLLETNPDMSIKRAKPAYEACRRVFALFDDSLARIDDFKPTASAKDVALYAYRRSDGAAVVTVWSKAAAPVEANTLAPVDLILPGIKFTQPVYADLLTGNVYALPADNWSAKDGAVMLSRIPIYDSPIVIAEKDALLLEAVTGK